SVSEQTWVVLVRTALPLWCMASSAISLKQSGAGGIGVIVRNDAAAAAHRAEFSERPSHSEAVDPVCVADRRHILHVGSDRLDVRSRKVLEAVLHGLCHSPRRLRFPNQPPLAQVEGELVVGPTPNSA